MVKYRNKLHIIADILSIARKGAKKTEIMYRANLSYKLLCRYLAEVVDAGLVSFKGSAGCYRLTRKGRVFLKQFGEYSKRHKQVEEQINDVNNQRMVLKKMLSSNLNSRPNQRAASKKREDTVCVL